MKPSKLHQTGKVEHGAAGTTGQNDLMRGTGHYVATLLELSILLDWHHYGVIKRNHSIIQAGQMGGMVSKSKRAEFCQSPGCCPENKISLTWEFDHELLSTSYLSGTVGKQAPGH